MAQFENFIENLGISELIRYQAIIKTKINSLKSSHKSEAISKNVHDFVSKPHILLNNDSVEFASISAEVESLNMPNKALGKSDCITQWLTLTGQSYAWKNSRGNKTVKDPLSFDNFPGILGMLNQLNSEYGVSLNSCLISCLPDGQSKLRLHDDGEESLDETQPIIVLTVGAERDIEFRGKYQHPIEKSALTIRPPSGSVYQMLPGCQSWFNHRVMGERTCRSLRYSLSFRRMLPESELIAKTQPSVTPGPPAASNAAPPSCLPTLPLPPNGPIPHPSSEDPPPGTVRTTLPGERRSLPKRKVGPKRTTVLFGTSITSRVVGSRLGRKDRKVLNFSESGARISDIKRMVDDFHDYHVDADDVEKIILCFGTNDIKHSKNGIRHLVSPVFSLINRCKSHFPGATICVCSNLPMRNMYNYTAHNFLTFNNILRDACYKTNTFYIDFFNNFLSYDRMDFNHLLFRDNFHLNNKGLGVLCSILKMIINCDCFSAVIKCDYGYF